MTPDEKAYMRAVTDIKESRSEVSKVAEMSWSDIEEELKELEFATDAWSEEEILLIPECVRTILFARIIHGMIDDATYADQIKAIMVLRIRSIVARYNENSREGIVGDLFKVDADGRVLVDLSAIREVSGGQEGAGLG